MAKFKSIENEEQLFTADLQLDDLVNMAINKVKKETINNDVATKENNDDKK